MANSTYGTPASDMPLNPADEPEFYEKGYPSLAYFFSNNPRYLHLRRFSGLSIRLLLYRQCELVHLEKQLLGMDKSNISSIEGRRSRYHIDYAATLTDPHGSKFRNLVTDIRNRLKEYEEDLIRFEKLGLKGFDMAKVKVVQDWLDHPELGALILDGQDRDIWGTGAKPDGHALDIIQVVKESESSPASKYLQDGLSRWSSWTGKWLTLFSTWQMKKPDKHNWHIQSRSSFQGLSLTIGSVLTSVLVYGAIISLNFVSGKAFNIVVAILVPLLISLCGLGFVNQKSIATWSMLGT
ncbi:uncharacterized protein EI97DRAFT_454409 [Westerdykella ornata]|uniref:DUF6594 domain-containing protein n=1 Tax=Westerdykella ornata TaxID=318751 RepID=A0A6A6JZC7_WESOR|nr:uncharacterized protein EI97DRAFT_454409 [Westerdykella ornata]KAF2281198.1 hypothetical protein EI97DRAFT_454409 [Westerdykella ornata]